ncbi:hypothetical protein [Undibacterium flavidum]|uniref:DUF2486 family protein n=1 Tax=Undibacterium flavidum TaxID=2762297 RepID=A0ABR6YI15_9BURK|nr:hypothetical protein [Undibacterium flavidum]MBC3876094.1 hypothetical protein [Undibacterium flavidum]
MNDQIDESIPVLTEVISAPNDAPVAVKSKAESHFPLVTDSHPISKTNVSKPLSAALASAKEVLAQPDLLDEAPTTTEKSKSISAEEWAQLELTVRENVLRQVLSRVDFVLEHRVSDSLADVLQTAVDRLADEIRAGLRHSIEEVVTRALNQEITKIKGSNR